MKKKTKKAQSGALFAKASPSKKTLITEDVLPIVTEPVFNTKAEHDAYYLNQSIQKLSPEDRQWYEDAKAGKVKNVTTEDILALRAPTPLSSKYTMKGKKEPMGNVLGRAYGLRHGGIIEDNMGQLKHPGKITKINSNKITMKGVKTPLLGISNTGDTKMMFPEQEYSFNGDSVTEIPMGKSGIYINPKNKGKFNALKKRTGKSTEELTHSKNPLTRKRAIFAQNAAKWNKKQDGGNILNKNVLFKDKINIAPEEQETIMRIITENNPEHLPLWAHPDRQVGYGFSDKFINDAGNLETKPIYNRNKKAQFGGSITNENMFNQSPIQTNWGSENIFTPGQFSVQGQLNQFNNSLPQQSVFGEVGEKLGGAQGILNTGTALIGGIQQIGQDRENKNQAKQFYKLSKLVNKASSLKPEKIKRKYVRPEDNLVQPGELSSPYGVGTNFLEDGGTLQSGGIMPIFNQAGNFLNQVGIGRSGNLGQMLGSAIGGGRGTPSGASQVGSTLGGVAGSFLGPVGGAVGSFLGGAIGGLIGGETQRQTRNFQRKGNQQLQAAAFQQGTNDLHNQYVGFMQNGGIMGGELQMYNGEAELMSQNPYLPDNGETVMFKGASHKNGGIDMKFGKSLVEVEGGEPAVQLENGGEAGLTVFGNMKIPSYGVTELHDKNAKGKKFKNYIKDLSEEEKKQNKIITKSSFAIDDNPLASAYDKLKMSSNEAMLIGADMNLKEIARKKEIASGIQNAILETAEEFGLESEALSRGKIKKSKMNKVSAQDGKRISRSEVSNYLKQGWIENPDNPNQLILITKSPGKTETVNVGEYNPGSEEFQRAFGNARKLGIKEFDYKGKKYNTDLYQGRTKTISYPGSENRDYLDIYDPLDTTPLKEGMGQFDGKSLIRPLTLPKTQQSSEKQNNKFDALGVANTLLPYLRPSNQLPLDPNQLSGEMYALATNQLEPVQAQLYQPLLENVSDISLQDQLNANQADFNSIQRNVRNNPAALALLAAQKYAANTSVLGEQFRLNQGNRMNVYNKNRGVLNDATLRNLAILDQQYVRQSTAKSNTKATAQAALSSISDKIAKNKLENRTLGIYENLYNYRFGPKGQAWNLNEFANFQIPSNLPVLPTYVDEIVPEGKEAEFNSRGQLKDIGTKAKTKKTFGNGSIVKSLKSY